MSTEALVMDVAQKTCESCGHATAGHTVIFEDGSRFEVCGCCLPILVPEPRQP